MTNNKNDHAYRQSGFTAIRVILFIIAGVAALSISIGTAIYLNSQPKVDQPINQNTCGDGVCGSVEQEKGVCPQDCKSSGNQQSSSTSQNQNQGSIPANIKFGSDVRLTDDKSISTLSFNNAHPFVFKNGVLYLVWSDTRDGNAEIYFKYSKDYGKSWSSDLRITNSSGTSSFPSMAVGSNNYIYVVWDDDREGMKEIFYKYSSDEGKNWSSDKKISSSAKKAWYPDITADGNNIYIAWQDQRNTQGEIYFIRSTDGGKTFESEKRLTNAAKESERPSLAVDNNHNVNIVWYDWRTNNNPEVFYFKSSDYGQNFGEQKQITSTLGQTGLPSIVIDTKNKIHVAYLDGEKSGQMYLYYLSSSDNGNSWQADYKKLNSYSTAWFPTIAYKENFGLYIFWQDTVNNDKEIFYISSQDEGKNWNSPVRFTEKTGDSTTPFILIDDKNQLHIVWEDSRDGNREIYYKSFTSSQNTNSSIPPQNSTSSTSSSGQSTGSCVWSQAENLGSTVNTSNTEKAPAISPDGKELYFFREAVGGKFDIYLSQWNGNSWITPTNSGKVSKINSSTANDIGPFISRDGLRLYFSSNRAGANNYDLYYSSRNSTSDSWGTPTSLNNVINLTNESELGPTLNQNETIIFFARGWPQGAKETSENLYYSEKKNGEWTTPISWEHNTFAIEDNPELNSDGTKLYLSIRDDYNGKYYTDSYGDFDIYVSEFKDGKWQKPVNMGSAINTKYHDANSAISADGKTMYFSSKDRAGGYGNFDIYISQCK